MKLTLTPEELLKYIIIPGKYVKTMTTSIRVTTAPEVSAELTEVTLTLIDVAQPTKE